MYSVLLECSKHYTDHRQQILQRMAFGHGVHVVEKHNKQFIILPNVEINISVPYSEDLREQLEQELWSKLDIEDKFKENKKNWPTVKKKDKIVFLQKYVSQLDIPLQEKRTRYSKLLFLMLLKQVKPSDIVYSLVNGIEYINEELLENMCNFQS